MGCVKSVPEDGKPAKDDKDELAKAQRRRLSVAPEHVGDTEGDKEAGAAVEAKEEHENEDGLTPLESKSRGGFRHAAKSQKGFVPYNRNKVNQDREVVVYGLQGDEDIALFACMDGHGEFGHLVAAYVKNKLPYYLEQQENLKTDTPAAMTNAIKDLVDALAKENDINCTFSGTTCVFAVKVKDVMYVGNIGDSRCVVGRTGSDGRITTIALSEDQKPENPEEKKRIIANGGRVEPLPGPPGEDCGPPRVWLAEVDVPGLAMSRSIGDDVSQSVGVISVPEIRKHDITDQDKFAIWASDGVWEFISNQEAVKLVNENIDDLDVACTRLVNEANKRWTHEEEVVDDITCIILRFPTNK